MAPVSACGRSLHQQIRLTFVHVMLHNGSLRGIPEIGGLTTGQQGRLMKDSRSRGPAPEDLGEVGHVRGGDLRHGDFGLVKPGVDAGRFTL